jgi:outer membrane protein assembly factor BamB
VSHGTIYWETSDGGLFHATDAVTGKDRFTLDFKNWPMFSSPAVVGDTVYFGSENGRFYAVDAKRGAIAWDYETDLSKKNDPVLSNPDGSPNYSAVSHENFYESLVIAANRMFETGMILSSPTVGSDGTVYFGSMDGDVYALKAKG